ncbi:MAG: TonB-dependent receptor [Massilibacteroides sp.]|nr:TonB-dependent receptor [Massilibacteroides sp.]MDD3061367.1 TonB-dependent receptor [Massilibacteroides sp.]MDD4114884.1 TonB-dependent receptor [Massilibacteroides sp.]MDD4659458.1 TonB-dependent receptor [Massilibacteroides sp.]
MRISTLFLFLCIFSSFASKTISQNAKVNLRGNNLTIAEFIDQVENQTDYLFIYSKNEVNPETSLALNSGKKTVAQCLTEAFKDSDVKYAFENDYIVLTKNNIPSIAQQGKKISGTVTDSNGEPIIGANIIVKGSTNGTISDIDGNFTLQVPEGAVLYISYIGYLNKEVPVSNQTTYTVQLVEDTQTLEEVVVVGYGTMRKSDVTGSIGVAKGEELTKNQNFSALDNLRGKVSGVNIFSNSSQPGVYANRVIIRGMATINASSSPLYVVDGVVMENFELVNPNDIESMEVLKDASAAAIYGARGANGVILVTTKRGKKDGEGTQISYQGSVSASHIARKMDVLTAGEWVEAFMTGLENENKWQGKNWSLNRSDWFNDPDYFDADGNPLYDTNWQDEATRTAISHNHQINIQQAGKTSSVGAFLNYTDQQGIVNNTYNKRINAKLTYDANPTPWLSTAVNLLVNHTWGRYTPEDGGGQEARRTMIEMVPWMPVYDKYGNYTTSASSSIGDVLGFEGMSNPVMILDLQKRMRYNTQIFGNAAFTFHLAEGLDLKTQLGLDSHSKTYRGYSSIDLNNISMPNGWAEYQNWNSLYWQEETYLTYNKIFDEHRINTMVGLSWQERTQKWNKARTTGFSDDFFEDNNMSVGTTPDPSESSYERWAMNSYFLRLAYTYKDRYSATITGRVDGSSKFGENNKYAVFPSAGLAWNVSQEDFLADNNIISNLKLHTSYGLTGNSEISIYKSLAQVSSGTYLINGVRAPYAYVNSMANPDLKWEKTGQFDIGVELGLFQNRLNFDVAYYNKKTTDLLLDTPLPHSTGFSTVYKNIGSVRNSGLDIMVNARPVETRDFSWISTINLNYNKNKILQLGDNNEDIELNSWVGGSESILRVGENMSSFYGYRRYGVYTEEDYNSGLCEMNQIGRAKRSEKKEIIGKGMPDWTGSWINTINYKNFDLTMDLQFVWGVETMQQFYHSTYDRFGITNGLSNILYDAYDGTNPNTMQQAVYLSNSGHAGQDTTVDSQWISDGSYLRCNMLQFGYTFAPKMLKSIGLAGLRMYTSANNLFLITSSDFNGYDPESTSQGDSNKFGQNMTFFSYPRARTFTFGVNVTF